LIEIRCLVGHLYTPAGLLQTHSETQERAIWAAVLALEEAAVMVEALADFVSPEALTSLRLQAVKKAGQAARLREVVQELEPFRMEELVRPTS